MNAKVGMVRFNAGTLKQASMVQYFSDSKKSRRRNAGWVDFCCSLPTRDKVRPGAREFKRVLP